MGMNETSQLSFHPDKDGRLQLPERCSLVTSCYENEDARQAIAAAIEEILYGLALFGLDLRALDGITMAHDCRAAAVALQNMPAGQMPLEMSDPPDTMEMGRTVAVWREKDLRFHIVLTAGVGLMALSEQTDLQMLAHACIAHEAAHVQHEGHLYRTFPGIYGRPMECGDRSRQTFLKAMDVWSEYAACRTSALFRPEAAEEFERVFCCSLENGLSICKSQIAAYRRDQKKSQVFAELQQIFGDVFICGGYFFGHLDGLELSLEDHAPGAVTLLRQRPQVEALVIRLRRVLHELWLTEHDWKSIEVFAPIYDLICEMMAQHGLAFARHEDEWRIITCEDEHATNAIQEGLGAWMARPDKSEN